MRVYQQLENRITKAENSGKLFMKRKLETVHQKLEKYHDRLPILTYNGSSFDLPVLLRNGMAFYLQQIEGEFPATIKRGNKYLALFTKKLYFS